MNNNIEHLVADSALNEPIELNIDGVKMQTCKPKVSTLIAVSKHIGKLPNIPMPKTTSEEFEVVLAYAGDCEEVLGDIMAILILGRKGMITEKITSEIVPKKIFGITCGKKTIERKELIDNVKPLAEKILDEYSNKELYDLITSLFSEQNLAFFLNIITSLSRANLLKQKKMNETTASGL